MTLTEELNYFQDSRVRAKGKGWYKTFDEKSMKATVEIFDEETEEEKEVVVSVEFETCPTCDGKGVHVNPSIDASGLSNEDFYEDLDFAEDYHNGIYDVVCYECEGLRVVPVCLDEKVQQYLNHVMETNHQIDAITAAEIRMGA